MALSGFAILRRIAEGSENSEPTRRLETWRLCLTRLLQVQWGKEAADRLGGEVPDEAVVKPVSKGARPQPNTGQRWGDFSLLAPRVEAPAEAGRARAAQGEP